MDSQGDSSGPSKDIRSYDRFMKGRRSSSINRPLCSVGPLIIECRISHEQELGVGYRVLREGDSFLG